MTDTKNETEYENLETFSLLWLDAEVNSTDDNRAAQMRLRKIINYLKPFDNQQRCHDYITSLSSDDRIVLIVSGRCGRELVPQIHSLRQISSIYVYCMDKERNEEWARGHIKIKGVFICLKEMIDTIKADQRSRVKAEEPLPINFIIDSTACINRPDQSISELNGQFVHFTLLIDVLIRCKATETDKLELITVCKNEYQNNKALLDIVDEFRRQYSGDKVLWWYTRESFVYRMLNKALRIQNIEILTLFRFVIADIYQRLKRYQCSTCVSVYRGQIISTNELSTLRWSVNRLISINSFFSTSFNRQNALKFLRSSVALEDLRRVLFVISANPGVVQSKPFADISSYSYYQGEDEVLFMAGSVFRLVDIHWDNEDQVWIIRMDLSGEDEYDSKHLLNHMKEQHGGSESEIDLRLFGDVLHTMGKYNLAEKIYNRALNEPPENRLSRVHLYRSLGILMKSKAQFDSSLNWFHAALDIQVETCASDLLEISELYNWIGKIYFDKNNYNEALENYSKAFEYLKQISQENQLQLANIYNNMACVYGREEKSTEALEYYQKALILYQKHLPPDHLYTAMCYNNIGSVYLDAKRYDQAMIYFQQSLKMRLNSLPSQHPTIAVSYQSIGLVHENRDELEDALSNYQQAATIYRHSLPSEHPKVFTIAADIKRVSSRLNRIFLLKPIDSILRMIAPDQ